MKVKVPTLAAKNAARVGHPAEEFHLETFAGKSARSTRTKSRASLGMDSRGRLSPQVSFQSIADAALKGRSSTAFTYFSETNFSTSSE